MREINLHLPAPCFTFIEHLLYTDQGRPWGHSGEFNNVHVHVSFNILSQEEVIRSGNCPCV